MNIKQGKEYLTKQDLQQHSVWIEHDVDGLTYPVNGVEDLPENMRFNDLRIRSNFITFSGVRLNGYIIGLKSLYCIVIFLNDEIIYVNKNLYKDCLISIDKINEITGHTFSVKDFSPLKFETEIDIEGFKNIQGEFDLSKPRSEEERLDF